ncbi:hypothetical protein ZWY2020_054746 [Hordeum vulgare]|nr:hypothetical protein ZWY2020_054746 [Hordeum vulgare]
MESICIFCNVFDAGVFFAGFTSLYHWNVSDRDIVNRTAGIAISPLSYYGLCDNLYQVRAIVNYQILYPKDSNIVNQEGGKTLAEFPNSIELGKLGLGQDPNNDGALNYMFNK